MALARALPSNKALRTINLMHQKAGSKYGDACLDEFIQALDRNVTLLKITWRLDSRKSFSLTKLLNRNNEINRRLKSGRDTTELLPQTLRGNPPDLVPFVPKDDAGAGEDSGNASPLGKMLRSVRRASQKGVEAVGDAIANAGRRISNQFDTPSPSSPSSRTANIAGTMASAANAELSPDPERAAELAKAADSLRRAAAFLSDDTRARTVDELKAVVATLERMGELPAAASPKSHEPASSPQSHEPVEAVSPTVTTPTASDAIVEDAPSAADEAAVEEAAETSPEAPAPSSAAAVAEEEGDAPKEDAPAAPAERAVEAEEAPSTKAEVESMGADLPEEEEENAT